ncbi:putative signal transduction protein [Methylophaga thiooxydans]|uniref:Putative signal transduction protein n=1 Tax=Methylophaga thiooxydans TaxID=392484 RepID=A0A0A0BJX8_9GAMM|nr:HDOD domain-containing protein [Methylophaga thiooxydans]KGM07414.1 putative signal transduction protein [Methylophaga thiooxydans]
METLNERPLVVIARQPIFDRQFDIYAYELLFRSASDQTSADLSSLSGDTATSRVINYAFLELGIERVIGNHTAFINLTRNFILNEDPLPTSQNRVIVEILEDIIVDDELLDGVRKLIKQGYTIALDDFIFHESLRPLVELASIIKVDILALDEAALREHVTILRKYDVKLLAEKVETREEFELCMELGFDFFQGFFFCRPDNIEDTPIPDNQLILVKLMQKLQEEDVEFEEIEQLISHDPGLTYKLLRLLNSAAIGMPRQINSIRQGLVILGLKAIKTWTSLIIMSELDSVPEELLDQALIRAKMGESLAPHYACSSESSFLVGLFSTIDAMLNQPMAIIVKSLPLADETKQALLHKQGELGQLLNDIELYERGLWSELENAKASLEIFSQSYINAAEWTIQTKDVV